LINSHVYLQQKIVGSKAASRKATLHVVTWSVAFLLAADNNGKATVFFSIDRLIHPYIYLNQAESPIKHTWYKFTPPGGRQNNLVLGAQLQTLHRGRFVVVHLYSSFSIDHCFENYTASVSVITNSSFESVTNKKTNLPPPRQCNTGRPF